MPTCLSHFLIFCIHCSPFGNRSKWRRRRAAVVIATAKGQTTQLGWNKKSWGFLFSFPSWLKTAHCFEQEACDWHCQSWTVPPGPPPSSLPQKGETVRVWWEKVLSDTSIEKHSPFYFHSWGFVSFSPSIVHSITFPLLICIRFQSTYGLPAKWIPSNRPGMAFTPYFVNLFKLHD